MRQDVFSRFSAALFLFCALFSLGAASQICGDDLPPIQESKAYHDFLKQPITPLSKGVCILNYFRDLPLIVQYDGVDYPMLVAYPIGMAYFLTNYKGEDPRHWIKKTCYRSLQNNNIIYFKFQDGRFRPARDVLLEKMDELDKALKEKR